jgi:hypothetical protein
MAYLAQKHEQKAQRPIYPEAYQYYLDLYAEKKTSSFHIIKDIKKVRRYYFIMKLPIIKLKLELSLFLKPVILTMSSLKK